MDYLTNYYKNLSEQLQQRVNFLQNLLEDDKKQEKKPIDADDGGKEGPDEEDVIKTTSFRKEYETMYGKEKFQKIIDAIKLRQKVQGIRAEKDPKIKDVLDKLSKTYDVPVYSDKNLDKPIDVVFGKTKTPMATAEYKEKDDKDPRDKIVLSKEDPTRQIVHIIDRLTKGLPPDPRPGGSYHNVIPHELTHSQQEKGDYDFELNPDRKWIVMPGKTKEELDLRHQAYLRSPKEMAARISPLKYAYYKETGTYLDANSTDYDFNKFKEWYRNQQKSKAVEGETGKFNPTNKAVDILDTETGKELWRQTAKANTPNITRQDSNEMMA